MFWGCEIFLKIVFHASSDLLDSIQWGVTCCHSSLYEREFKDDTHEGSWARFIPSSFDEYLLFALTYWAAVTLLRLCVCVFTEVWWWVVCLSGPGAHCTVWLRLCVLLTVCFSDRQVCQELCSPASCEQKTSVFPCVCKREGDPIIHCSASTSSNKRMIQVWDVIVISSLSVTI